MTNSELLKKFTEQVQADNSKKPTQRRKIKIVTDYIDFLDKHDKSVIDTNIQDIERFIATKAHLKVTSLNAELTHIRMFYEFLQQREVITQNIKKQIKFRSTPKQLPKNISQPMMLKLCEPTKQELEQRPTKTTLRNQAIIEFLFSTGVRNSELRAAKLKQLSPDLTQCLINTTKGGPMRLVFLGKYARTALYLYLQSKGMDIKRLEPWQQNMNIFTGPRGKPLHSVAVTRAVKALGIKRIGCPVTPHMIRHTFATEMLKATGCLRTVQAMMGHARIDSTVRYCHLSTADKKKAIETFHPRSIIDKTHSM